uniref:Uncharacterized protein n=1 Tax=Aegilops tauschii subsp. strangulata TaxID=200361 RepID=A0A452XND7_AEGTS
MIFHPVTNSCFCRSRFRPTKVHPKSTLRSNQLLSIMLYMMASSAALPYPPL